jgi:putative hydrolase of the HAD superfamily
MKPHPSIFAAALQLVDVDARHAIMVGDSVRQDVEGALRAGMRAVLLQRGGIAPARARELDVPVIQSLRELAGLIFPGGSGGGGPSRRVKVR